MNPPDFLPPAVEHVVADFSRSLDVGRVPPLRGLYLVGSMGQGCGKAAMKERPAGAWR